MPRGGRVKNSLLKAHLYLETTVPSYLTARPSRDLIRASHRQITREWWERRRADFELFISQLVLDEAAAGDPAAAVERLAALKDLPQLDITDDVVALAGALVAALALPREGRDRRGAHRPRRGSRNALPADVELHPHRQCRDVGDNRERLPRPRVYRTRDLHAGGIDGRVRPC